MNKVLLVSLLFLSIGALAQDALQFSDNFNISDEEFWKRKRLSYYINSTEILTDDKVGFYKRGIENLENDFYEEAISDFKRSVSDEKVIDLNWMNLSDNSKIYPLFYIGICKIEIGEIDSALIYFNKSIEKDSKFALAYSEIGNIYSEQSKYDEAQTYYDKALKLSPQLWFVHVNKTLSFLGNGQFNKAKKQIKLASNIFPDKEELFLLEASLYKYRGNISAANKAYSKAINLNRESFIAYYNRSILKIKRRKLIGAKQDILIARKIDSSHYQTLSVLGYINVRLDSLDLGIKQIAQSINREKKENPIYYTNSYSSMEFDDLILEIDSDKLTSAEKQIGKNFINDYFNKYNSLMSVNTNLGAYIKDSPDCMFENRINLFLLHSWYHYNIMRGSISVIRDYFIRDWLFKRANNLVKQDSNLVYPLILSSEYNFFRGDYETALSLSNKAIENQPDYAYAYNFRGLLHEQFKEINKSLRDYSYAIELCPDYGLPYFNRGRIYYLKEDYIESKRDILKSMQLNSGFEGCYNYLGKCYVQFEKLDSALICFSKAIKIDKMYADAYNGRGKIYLAEKEYELSENDFRKAIYYDDRNVEYYIDRAEYFIQVKRYEAARFDLLEARKLNGGNSRVYEELGRVLILQGKFRKSIDYSKTAIQYDGGSFTAMYNIALANLYLDNFNEAKKLYKHYAILNMERTGTILQEALNNLEELKKSAEYKKVVEEIITGLRNKSIEKREL